MVSLIDAVSATLPHSILLAIYAETSPQSMHAFPSKKDGQAPMVTCGQRSKGIIFKKKCHNRVQKTTPPPREPRLYNQVTAALVVTTVQGKLLVTVSFKRGEICSLPTTKDLGAQVSAPGRNV